jgi:hypothetical protein
MAAVSLTDTPSSKQASTKLGELLVKSRLHISGRAPNHSTIASCASLFFAPGIILSTIRATWASLADSVTIVRETSLFSAFLEVLLESTNGIAKNFRTAIPGKTSLTTVQAIPPGCAIQSSFGPGIASYWTRPFCILVLSMVHTC